MTTQCGRRSRPAFSTSADSDQRAGPGCGTGLSARPSSCGRRAKMLSMQSFAKRGPASNKKDGLPPSSLRSPEARRPQPWLMGPNPPPKKKLAPHFCGASFELGLFGGPRQQPLQRMAASVGLQGGLPAPAWSRAGRALQGAGNGVTGRFWAARAQAAATPADRATARSC